MIVATRKGAKCWFGINLPKHVISISKNYPHDKWEEYTIYDVLKEKRDKNVVELKQKCCHPEIRACFIWIFYNDTFFYGGWWIYIKTVQKDYALNFRHVKIELILKAMQMFPCGVIPVYENFYQWAEQFAKAYPSKAFNRNIQGLKPCVCLIDEYGNLKDIASDFQTLRNTDKIKKLPEV